MMQGNKKSCVLLVGFYGVQVGTDNQQSLTKIFIRSEKLGAPHIQYLLNMSG